MIGKMELATGIFLLTYALIVAEKLPRTAVALAGGLAMILLGLETQEQGLHHVDFNTLGLLIGMMIIVGIIRKTGVFEYLALTSVRLAKGRPLALLVYLSLLTAGASAFLDNVTTVLLVAPVTFTLCREMGISPIPFLISEIIASNVGGTATLIGDPPNIMIGSAVKELSFLDFMLHLGPVAIIVMAVTLPILVLIYRRQLVIDEETRQRLLQLDPARELKKGPLLYQSLGVLALTILGFFLHQVFHIESATIAMGGAVLLLLLSRIDLEEAFHTVEWGTIFFFVGLFVLVGGLVETGVISRLAQWTLTVTSGETELAAGLILWVAALASAFVDNIPFVATMIPLIKEVGLSGGIANLEPLWWSLALGACLGGNGTLVGASANVIVAGMAESQGKPIGFLRFMLVAFPLMLLSIVISHIYITWRYF
ncbi:ArsB/NhaD family transporter [Carboxydocella sp. JDF658]|uniref:ArsB/NhaD family transporter n=1 Tax=Carboxydocella sp. JDF658 TaxID=1926600 RepID=UPI0009AD4B71|nr:ArsB/NhaD family transporter [Carboxydocella sp. JDF658]GAW30515.1 hypothetical protein JDF658_02800 [Carboxydocella sp. JDF658]